METTRRYPRTLNEAFPNGPEYANAIEHCDARVYSAAGVLAACAIGVCAALAWTFL